VVIARYGAVVCFSANAASYIPFFLSLYFIYPRGGIKIKQESTEVNPIQQIKEFRNLFLNPDVRFPLMTIFITNLFCAPLITFSAVLIKNVFHAEATHFGWAVTAFGTGGLIGAAITFIPLPKFFKRNIFASILAIFCGLLIIAIALNHSIYLLITLLVFAGISLTTSNISINTFLQENIKNNVRGRLVSLFQLALSGGISIGALFTGFTVAQLNISNALLINGIFAITFQIWLLWKQLKTPVIKTLL